MLDRSLPQRFATLSRALASPREDSRAPARVVGCQWVPKIFIASARAHWGDGPAVNPPPPRAAIKCEVLPPPWLRSKAVALPQKATPWWDLGCQGQHVQPSATVNLKRTAAGRGEQVPVLRRFCSRSRPGRDHWHDLTNNLANYAFLPPSGVGDDRPVALSRRAIGVRSYHGGIGGC